MFTKGSQVTFVNGFSAALVGVTFEVDSPEPRTEANTGREYVGIRTRVGKRWSYRLAYTADLIAA